MASNEPRWHPGAEQDAREARDWYAERSPFAARGFLLSLDDALTAVVDAPERFPLHKHGCRHYVFPSRYPFTLVYRHSGGVLEIVAVAHHKRRPDHWRNR